MEGAKGQLTILLVIAICISTACGSPPSTGSDRQAGRVEVYYRDFNSLAPIQYSEDELIRSATFKAVLTDRPSIEAIREVKTLACVVDPDVRRDQMDTYLLIREYSDGHVVSTWAASRFHFLEQPGKDQLCELEPRSLEAIERVLGDLARNGKAKE